MQTIKNQGAKMVLLALVALALLSGCTPAGPRALLKGETLLDEGKFPEALEQLKTAASLLPTNAQAFNFLGLALHHNGRPAEAEKAYLRALALNRELAEVHYNLGCLWLSQNKLEPAKGEFTAYTLRQPSAAEGWVKLGTVQLRSRDPMGAERSFNEALRLKPQSAEALSDLGLVRVQRNRPQEAVQYFEKALKLQPDFSPALLNLAIVTQEHLKDKHQALQRYQEYLALKPTTENSEAVKKIAYQLEQDLNSPPPPTNTPPDTLAQKSTNNGQSKMALAASNSPAPSGKSSGLAQTNLSKTDLGATARPRLVIETNKAAPVADASGPKPQNSSASPALSTRMEPDKNQGRISNTNHGPGAGGIPTNLPKTAATTEFAKARDSSPLELVTLSNDPVLRTAEDIRTVPGAPTPSNLNSLSSSTTPNKSLAAAANPQGLQGNPQAGPPEPSPARYAYKLTAKPAAGQHTQAERPFGEGVHAQSAQHFAEAIRCYRQAIQLDPAYFDAYYNLGLAAIASNDLPLALATYETALALRPDSLDARYNFALALKQSNYPIDAANELQKLLAAYPNESRAHLMLANLYSQQLHQPAKAKQHYLKVLETDPGNPQASAIHYWLRNNPL